MNQGDNIEYCTYGYDNDGRPVNGFIPEILKYENTIVSGNTASILAVKPNGVIRIVDAEKCKILKSKEEPLLG